MNRTAAAQAIVTAALDSVVDGLLDVEDLAALAGPVHMTVLAGPPLGCQIAPDSETNSGADPVWREGAKRYSVPLNVTNGRILGEWAPGSGRPADRTSRHEQP
jgi:hypothetical protein